MMKQYIGIDIGGTMIKFALIDQAGKIGKKWRIPTNLAENGAYIPSEIAESIENELPTALESVKGIGIGVPGPISRSGETVLEAVNLGWKKLPLKKGLEERLGIPVALINDANAAALGEMWQGVSKGKRNLLFVTLGTGVGGGIVLNGKILNGVHSSGGEIGHIPISSSEHRLCGCGNINCLETFCSANGLVKTMKVVDPERAAVHPGFTAVDIFKWVAAGDLRAQEALAATIERLGMVLAGIMNTIDVEEIVIGGGLSEAGDALLAPLRLVVDAHIFPQIRGNYHVKKAALGNDAGIYGAVYYCLSVHEMID